MRNNFEKDKCILTRLVFNLPASDSLNSQIRVSRDKLWTPGKKFINLIIRLVLKKAISRKKSSRFFSMPATCS